MDFDLTDRQKHWQGRVREFIERKVRPAVPVYKEQDAAGDRWKVIQVVEDLKAAMSMRPSSSTAGPHQPRICPVRRRDGPRRLCERSVQLLGARHRQYGSLLHRYGTRAQKENGCAR
jgi:alkylation response protein AidB-like acyl-CoA dehydrogenase